jgi:hypothetical protein
MQFEAIRSEDANAIMMTLGMTRERRRMRRFIAIGEMSKSHIGQGPALRDVVRLTILL